jgi:saccharopine dehydrogenase-like NADP-dependent oxidoreductase
MRQVLVVGAGQIGSLIAFLLANTHDYEVYLADLDPENSNIKRLPKLERLKVVGLDAGKEGALANFLKKTPIDAIISSLPYYANLPVALAAKEFKLHYFDLTEDVETTKAIVKLAKNAKTAFVPQCGLAPGFISIVANHLMKRFPAQIDSVKMRVGALPTNISNALQYSLTWSIDGLINEYGNLCHGIEHSQETMLLPLDDLEEIKIDGLTYEAFNTSGGVGSLVNTYLGKVNFLSYKTIRYPGHCSKIRFLMQDLKLNQDRETLKRILENSIPRTYQDVVLVYVSVTGMQGYHFIEENYVKKFYPRTIDGVRWSAIQMTTASSICCSVDLVLNQPQDYVGFICQEQFSLQELLTNRFGEYYADTPLKAEAYPA